MDNSTKKLVYSCSSNKCNNEIMNVDETLTYENEYNKWQKYKRWNECNK